MTVPEPAAYESLERRLDEVLGADHAATLRIVLASLATKDDVTSVKDDVTSVKDDVARVKDDVARVKDDVARVKDDVSRVEHDLGLVRLDVADFKKDVHHEFALVRTEMLSMKNEIIGVFRGEVNAAITSQTKPLLVSIVGVAAVVAGAVLGAFQLA